MLPEKNKHKAKYFDIEAGSNSQYSPLSFQQERVLYLHKMSEEGALWNRITCKKLLGNIDVDVLREAVDSLVERHSALKTRISFVDGAPLQSKHTVLEGAFEYIDLSSHPEASVEKKAREILNREYEELLALESGQLFKAVAVRCKETEVWLILKLHHIISDATTLRILWNDLKIFYNSHSGSVDDLVPLELEYSDYARWLREKFHENDTKEQEAYWLNKFKGELPKLDLPADFLSPPKLTFRGALERQELPKRLIKRLQSFSLAKRVIPFSTMMSAYYLLLHNYCRQDDIVIGSVFLGRHYSPQINRLAGFFANTVALRAQIVSTQTVGEFVQYVHSQVSDAYEMQDYPLERLVGKLDTDRRHERNPLFRAMFNMVTGHEEKHTFEGVHEEEWLEPEVCATQVDFLLDFHLNPGVSELRVEYNADIFSKTTIQRMLSHYITIVEKIIESPDVKVSELSLLDATEEKLVLAMSQGDITSQGFARGIPELLEERAAQMPQQTALLAADQRVTCDQLNIKVNQLAATLVDAGVKEADTVAIMVNRSPEMVYGLLAIMKAGAAYLPIDPLLPQQRVTYILHDSGTKFLLAQRESGEALVKENSDLSLTLIPIDMDESYSGEGENIGRKVVGSNPAYVIYTSGSTGNPKGVVVEHSSLMNTLEFLEAKYPLSEKTILLKTNFTFDVSCAELFGWIFDGGKVAVLGLGAEKDPSQIFDAIKAYGVTHINFVPSMLDTLLSGMKENEIKAFGGIEYVFVAGEALKPDLVNRFHNMINDVRLENLYGPTEGAIYATWYSLPRGEGINRVSIGKPLANTRSYILNDNLELLPVGVIGELCLSGAGVARGYLNNLELTKDKFCPDPYWEGEKLYRTGDLAKWDENGLIQFLGRSDGQLKIRGFRVEIGEVERKLLGCNDVVEAAVTTKVDQFGQKGLVAYIVKKQNQSGTVEGIRKELAAWLPCYMIPDFIMELEDLPRLPSGKVNLQALPDPERNDNVPTASQVEATKLEKEIIEIAESLLNATGLKPDSNFFQMGGNSLLTLRFIAELDDTLGTSLSVMDFLELPTLAEIAVLIESSDEYQKAQSESTSKSLEGAKV